MQLCTITQPTTPGDYWIRFTTTEQQTAASFDTETSANVKTHTDGFPHQGYAILRVKDPAATSAEPKYLSDYSPIACDGTTTVNCGEDYVSLACNINMTYTLCSEGIGVIN